jgi:hypothetical protein
MPEIVTLLISALVVGTLDLLNGAVEWYFRYKSAQAQGTHHVYKIWESNCCSTVTEHDHDHDSCHPKPNN